MALSVMLVVILGAASHAAWNVLVKSSSDQLSEAVLVACASAAIAACFLPFVEAPATGSSPYLATSVTVHCFYFLLLGLAYRRGDLSYAYPLMRGTAPLLTACLTGVVLNEGLGTGQWIGVVVLSAGVLLLGAERVRAGRMHWPTTALALANAGVIVAYTLADGIGVRLSQTTLGYVVWLFSLNAIPLLAVALVRWPRPFLEHVRARWRWGAAGGLCSAASYGAALWAMTHAPIALVAALRETSVVFATLFAAWLLKERLSFERYVAAGLVTAGAVAMKLW